MKQITDFCIYDGNSRCGPFFLPVFFFFFFEYFVFVLGMFVALSSSRYSAHLVNDALFWNGKIALELTVTLVDLTLTKKIIPTSYHFSWRVRWCVVL